MARLLFLPRSLLAFAFSLLGGWIAVLLCSIAQISGTSAQLVVMLALTISAWRGYCALAPLSVNAAASCQPLSPGLERWLIAASCTVAVLAGVLRFSNLGWSEFQGDEARVMLLADQVISGKPASLFQHRKGPGEILTAATSVTLFQDYKELAARLPFAISGVAALLLLAACAFHLGGILGAASILLLGLSDGVLLGFSRIVQYQMPMLLFGISGWYLLLTGFKQRATPYILLAAGAICHYDAIFFIAPAFVYLLVTRTSPFLIVRGALLLIVPVLCFYIPFLLSDNFSQTAQYLSARAGALALPTNNLPRWVHTWEIYSGAVSTGLIVVALLLALRGIRGWFVAWAATLLFVFTALVLKRSDGWSAFVLVVGALILVALKSTRPAQLWMMSVALVYVPFGFWFSHPNTHFLAGTPAILLGCAWALAQLPWRWRLTLIALQVGLFPAVLMHQKHFFFRENTTRPDTRRSVVEFGFSHHTGLRIAAQKLTEQISEDSRPTVWVNDDTLVARWYLRHFAVTESLSEPFPEYVVLLTNPREPQRARIDVGRRYHTVLRLRSPLGSEDLASQGSRLADVMQLKNVDPTMSY